MLEKYIAGVQLTGTEIKSVRQGKVSLNDGYCVFISGELWIKNIHIAEYDKGTHYNHEPTRMRKLLLQKRVLKKILAKVKERGMTIVVVSMFINERGWAKLEIALAKGKKLYDKRETIKKKDVERDMARTIDN